MTDVRIKHYYSVGGGPTMDWFITDAGTLDDREELATAGRVALGTDALAGELDTLPDPDSTDRRGWWGDQDADTIWNGWPIGCKNWLLTRAKISDTVSFEGSTLSRAKNYTIEALQPFLTQGIASQMSAQATLTDQQTIQVDAKVYRGPISEINLRYQVLWEEPDVFDVPPVKVPVNIVRRIPYPSLTLTSTAPIVVVTYNVVTVSRVALTLSSVAPIVGGSFNIVVPKANIVTSPTAPIRSP